ncbi:hypothetical protein KAU33_10825 [Candidatus Dependentiae bacterium]|nr:hypothetical protein [Candidatus Dependentiae bacterium]
MFDFFWKQVNQMALLKDIKPQEELSYNYINLILFVLGVIAVTAMLIYFIFKLRTMRKNHEPFEVVLPPIPFEELLLIPLKEFVLINIDEEQLRFYIVLNFMFRLMLEKKYNFNALEFTTREILKELKLKIILKKDFDLIKSFLRRSDLIKFYNYNAAADEVLKDKVDILSMIKVKTKLNSELKSLFKQAEN